MEKKNKKKTYYHLGSEYNAIGLFRFEWHHLVNKFLNRNRNFFRKFFICSFQKLLQTYSFIRRIKLQKLFPVLNQQLVENGKRIEPIVGITNCWKRIEPLNIFRGYVRSDVITLP